MPRRLSPLPALLLGFAAVLAGAGRVGADETRLVVEPSQIEVDPGARFVITATLRQGDQILRAEPWAFRFEAAQGALRGNLYEAPRVPGRYVVRVSHPGSGSRQETIVSVRFPRPVASFAIAPPGRDLTPGERFAFRVEARDDAGQAMDVRPEWRASRGRIAADGTFEAPADPGVCAITAFGPGRYQATLEVPVRQGGGPDDLLLDPVGIEVDPGERVVLTLHRKSGARSSTVPPWRAQWTASAGTLDGNVWTAPDQGGECLVLAEFEGSRAEARFQVRRQAPALSRIRLVPESATVGPGESVSFQAIGEAEDGVPVPFEATWRASDGRVDGAGRFEAPATEGSCEVAVADAATRITAKAIVRVALLAAERLTLAPATATLRPGEKVRFEATALDARGRPASIDAEWQAAGGTIEGGVFTAGDAYGPNFQVTLRDRRTDRRATATVRVDSWPAARLVLEPVSPRVEAGQKIQFEGRAFDSAGRPVPAEWRWKAQKGSIDAAGLFVAPEEAGEWLVVLTEAGSGRETSVRVTVAPRPARTIRIQPETLTLAPGASAQFSARLLDQAGNEVAGRILWKAEGGTIDPNGRFQAGKSGGKAFRVTARDEATGLEAGAVVEITPPDVWTLRVDPAKVLVEIGARVALSASLEKNGQVLPMQSGAFAFEPDAGAGISIDAEGRFTAPGQPKRFSIRVRHPDSGATAVVEVEVRAPQPARIALEPASAELKPGQTVRFQAKVFDAVGRGLNLQPQFRADGGVVAADGTFTAGDKPGDRFRVHAYLEDPQLSASAEVRILAIDYRIEVSPSRTVVAPLERVTFKSTLLADGKRVDVWPWSFRYEADAGRFEESVYRAPEKAGTYEIRVSHEHGKATAEVVVRPGPAARVEVRPERQVLESGAESVFAAKAYDSAGNEVEATFQWRATGGEVDARGVYRAGASGGKTFEVAAVVTGTTISGRALIEVRAPETRHRLVVDPARIEVSPGELVEYRVVLQKDEKPVECWPWEIEFQAPSGSFRGSRYLAPEKPGTYEVSIRHARAQATAVVVVRPPAAVSRLAIEPASVTLVPGAEQRFAAVATNAAGEQVAVTVRWVAYGGEITAEGAYRAPTETGNYLVTALLPGTGLEASAKITVLKPDSVKLVVRPEDVTVRPGERIELNVLLLEGDNEKMVWPWDLEFRPEAGRMEESTYVSPTKPGTYRIDIIHPRARTAARVVVKAPSAARVEITPKSGRLRPGESLVFRAACYNEFGAELPAAVRWEATGGSIDAGGRFTAGEQGGRFSVVATEPESKVRAEIEVVVWVETLYLGLGKSWGEKLRLGTNVENDLVNYVIATIFFRSDGEVGDFRSGFVQGYGDKGEVVFQSAWQTVLFEFGRYYGREIRIKKSSPDEVSAFVAKHVLPLSPAELDQFRKGFLTGHTLPTATEEFEKILRRARQ